MNYQLRGFRFSFIIHTALLLLIITLNNSMVSFSKPVVIDFSIEDSSGKGDPKTAPAPKSRDVKVRQSQKYEPKPVVAKLEPAPRKPVPQQIAATSETAAGSQAPVSSRPPASVQPATGSSSAPANIANAEGGSSPSQGQGNPVEGMKQSYLKEHFAYIRNIVQKKLNYPAIARKMGWEGRVIVSFIVCLDGRAREIMVREGSGIDLLDRNAVSAVQLASPFPKPPVEAQLIIPIKYTLDL